MARGRVNVGGSGVKILDEMKVVSQSAIALGTSPLAITKLSIDSLYVYYTDSAEAVRCDIGSFKNQLRIDNGGMGGYYHLVPVDATSSIYLNCQNQLRRLNRVPLSLMATGSSLANVYKVLADSTKIFYTQGNTVRAHDALTLVYAAASANLGSVVKDICMDETYVYAATTSGGVKKMLKSTLEVVATTGNFNAYKLCENGNYLFVGDATANKLKKILKSDMSTVIESTELAGNLITADDNFVYLAFSNTVKKARNADFVVVATSETYSGGTIADFASDTKSAYVGGGAKTVVRYSKEIALIKGHSYAKL